MQRYIRRQFVDRALTHPLRFDFIDTETGEVVFTYDLHFKPGDYTQGTFFNRGYFQPIEDFLYNYDLNQFYRLLWQVDCLITSKFNQIHINSETLSARITRLESSLEQKAKIRGQYFVNSTVDESPAVDIIGKSLATTEFVRAFVEQYKFPPKNVSDIFATTNASAISLKWKDSQDFKYDEMNLAKWQGTHVVYRTDRYAETPDDGTYVVNNTFRNQYADHGYDIIGLDAYTKYYLSLFPYSDQYQYNYHFNNRIYVSLPHVESLSALSVARRDLAAATDGNGNVLFGGGYGRESGQIIVYNVVDKYNVNGTATVLTALSVARKNLAAATDGNGNVLFGGGGPISGGAYSIVDKYLPTGEKTTLTSISPARNFLAAATDGNGNVLFGGGYDNLQTSDAVDRYDKSGTKTTLPILSVARYNLAAATDGNGNVLFGGGNPTPTTTIGAVDKYTPAGTRTSLTSMAVAKYILAAATDGNGNVLFGGGANNSGDSGVVDKYTPAGTRTSLTSMSEARSNLAAATDGNGNVLFGGGRLGNAERKTIEMYNPNGQKIDTNYLSQSKSNLAAATDGNGNVLFGGGIYYTTFLSAVDRYTI